MDSMALEILGVSIDESFFLIGLAILLIEVATGFFQGKLKWRGVADMLVSASTQIPSVLVDIFILSFAYNFYLFINTHFISWSFENNAVSLISVIIIADFLYYWEHRLSHTLRVLWIHHAVHHSSRYMNIITGIRFGPFEGIATMVIMLPMVLIGFTPEQIIFANLVVLAYQTWIHTELIGKLGPVEWLMNTPSHHRVHHGCDKKYLDKNYGGIFIVWDRLFDSFQEEQEKPRYGLARDFESINPLKVWFSELPCFFIDVIKVKNFREFFTQEAAMVGVYKKSV